MLRNQSNRPTEEFTAKTAIVYRRVIERPGGVRGVGCFGEMHAADDAILEITQQCISGTKSDSSDARLLAALVRTDRHNRRRLAGDSPDIDIAGEGSRLKPTAISDSAAESDAARVVSEIICGSPK